MVACVENIADGHVHPWAHGTSTGHHRRTPITGEVLRREMAEAGVARALLVPPLWDPRGNAYALRLAAEAPDMFGVLGLVQIADGPELATGDPMDGWLDHPGMRGVRVLLNSTDRRRPYDEGAMDALWPSAERHGVPVALLAPGALDIAATLAERHPALSLTLDHLAVPRGGRGAQAFAHLPELLALARFPNVMVKASGVVDYALDGPPFVALLEPLRRIFDAFGPDRIVWASELSRLTRSYRCCVEHFCNLPWLDDVDRQKVMGGTLLRSLNWTKVARISANE